MFCTLAKAIFSQPRVSRQRPCLLFYQVDQRIEREDGSSESESAKLSPALRQRWQQFRQELEAYAIQVHQAQHSFAFAFVEGSLVHALREGHWVLLDEVNLASPETLECLNGLLDNPDGSVSRLSFMIRHRLIVSLVLFATSPIRS